MVLTEARHALFSSTSSHLPVLKYASCLDLVWQRVFKVNSYVFLTKYLKSASKCMHFFLNQKAKLCILGIDDSGEC